MEDTTTNYSTIIISVLMAVVIIATVMMPIITATTQTVTTTEIDNEGEGWLKLGYNEGGDYSFNVGYETITVDEVDTEIFKVGEQTGDYGNMICYADPQRTLFVSGDNWYLLTNGESPSVHKFTDTATVSNSSGTLTINDGSNIVYSGTSPDWAYVPDTNGVYGFFTNGGLTLEDGKPNVAVGTYAGIFAYNDIIVAPDDVELGLVMTGDYATGDVTWGVGTEETLPTDSQPSMAVMSSGYAEIPVMGTANPSGATRVGDLFYRFSGTDATVAGYSSSIDWSTFTSIPDTVSYNGVTYTVTAIGTEAFAYCHDLTLTSLPVGLTTIGDRAFQECTNLALTSLPSGLTSIGRATFTGCTNLALTSLPSGLTTMGGLAFRNCTNLALTSLPSGLTAIRDNTFESCTNLALTSLPSGLTIIENFAFQNCTSIALTSLPDGLTSIGNSVFNGCTNLALTSLPAGVTSIGNNAFNNCANLALTSLPDGITSIGSNAFSGCDNLALTSLPSGLTSIGDSAFSSCDNLALTSLPDGLTSINSYTFNYCPNLVLTSLPDGITSIGSNAFNHCTSIALTSLPDGLTSIGQTAFQACTSLTFICLPSGLTSIGGSAFTDCTNLNSIIILGSPTIGGSTFRNTGIKEVLNFGETEFTTTSYGLHADSVRSDVPALGYIAPVSIHETVIVEDTSLSATLLKLLPVFMALAVVIFIGYALLRPDSEFVKSLKSRL